MDEEKKKCGRKWKRHHQRFSAQYNRKVGSFFLSHSNRRRWRRRGENVYGLWMESRREENESEHDPKDTSKKHVNWPPFDVSISMGIVNSSSALSTDCSLCWQKTNMKSSTHPPVLRFPPTNGCMDQLLVLGPKMEGEKKKILLLLQRRTFNTSFQSDVKLFHSSQRNVQQAMMFSPFICNSDQSGWTVYWNKIKVESYRRSYFAIQHIVYDV